MTAPRRRHRGVEQIPWLYDLLMVLPEHGRLGRWRRWLVGGARGRVLDLGCGSGHDLTGYAAGTPVVGIDLSLENLRAARHRAPAVPLVQARAEQLPFRAGAFDTVVAALVLCSVDDPAAALGEVRRVLAPDGSLRIVEHVRSRARWAARLQDVGQRPWAWLTGGCRLNRETEAAVAAAGFRIEADGRRARGVMRRLAARVPPG